MRDQRRRRRLRPATLIFALARDALQLEFLTTITVFNDPRDVTPEELKLTSYFPIDARTEAHCKTLALGAC